jgi:hypothetical protein
LHHTTPAYHGLLETKREWLQASNNQRETPTRLLEQLPPINSD